MTIDEALDIIRDAERDYEYTRTREGATAVRQALAVIDRWHNERLHELWRAVRADECPS